MPKAQTVIGGMVSLVALIALIFGPSNLLRFVSDPLHASLPSMMSKFALPKAVTDRVAQYLPSSLTEDTKRAVTEATDAETKSASSPASDDALAVSTAQKTIQDGTSSQWDGHSTYQAPRYVTRKFLKITSKTDEITIRKIDVNRGNCDSAMLRDHLQPFSLKFGESQSFGIECDPIEVRVETNHGTYSFNWENAP